MNINFDPDTTKRFLLFAKAFEQVENKFCGVLMKSDTNYEKRFLNLDKYYCHLNDQVYFRVMKNKLTADILQKNKHKQRVAVDACDCNVSQSGTIEHQLLINEYSYKLKHLLTTTDYQMFMMHVNEFSLSDIAKKHNEHKQAVKRRLERIRKIFSTIIDF